MAGQSSRVIWFQVRCVVRGLFLDAGVRTNLVLSILLAVAILTAITPRIGELARDFRSGTVSHPGLLDFVIAVSPAILPFAAPRWALNRAELLRMPLPLLLVLGCELIGGLGVEIAMFPAGAFVIFAVKAGTLTLGLAAAGWFVFVWTIGLALSYFVTERAFSAKGAISAAAAVGLGGWSLTNPSPAGLLALAAACGLAIAAGAQCVRIARGRDIQASAKGHRLRLAVPGRLYMWSPFLLLDNWISIALSTGLALYMFRTPLVQPEAATVTSMVVLLLRGQVCLNLFGLDSPETIDRYALIPRSGEHILWSKLAPYGMLACVEAIAIGALLVARLGLAAGVTFFLLHLAMTASWGAWAVRWSWRRPFQLAPGTLTSEGSIAVLLAAALTCSAPGITVLVWGGSGGPSISIAALALLSMVCVAWLVRAVRKHGPRTEIERESIRAALR